MNIPQFVIAAPTSGAGKTTVSCGLMALLRSKGMQVQPYKCGPDYIDTKYHQRACGRPSINLDRFLASDAHIHELYARYAQGAEACVVEGMMGMYDGYLRDRGSSADVARLLRLPVVLVVDARSAAYSMAPLLDGFLHFRTDVEVAGVIFNKVGSERHRLMLREVCEDLGVTCLGFVPRRKAMEQESRYLGLDFSRPSRLGGDLLALLEENVDWRLLLERTSRPRPVPPSEVAPTTPGGAEHAADGQSPVADYGLPRPLEIFVARNDEAFSFIYQEHLDRLAQWGKVTFFDPEADELIPDRVDLLYLPGGYPEKHAGALSRARRTLLSIRDHIARGGRTLAECGGMIYLSQGIRFDEMAPSHGLHEPMARVLPFSISCMRAHRQLSLGYRLLTYGGQRLTGHEFHYTQFCPEEDVNSGPTLGNLGNNPVSLGLGKGLVKAGSFVKASGQMVADSLGKVGALGKAGGMATEWNYAPLCTEPLSTVAQVYDARGEAVATPIFRYKNTLASYTHLYWGEADLMRLFDGR